MRKAWLVVFLLASAIMMVAANVKTTQTQPVSAGFNIVFYFVFMWFLLFTVPLINKKE
jgi:hypothetical protein